MTKKCYIALCPHKILQKYFQGYLRTRSGDSLCASGNGFWAFCFAWVPLRARRVCRAELGAVLVPLINLGGLQPQVWNGDYIWKAFHNVFRAIPKHGWGFLLGLLETWREKKVWPRLFKEQATSLLLRQISVPGFPFRFWSWYGAKACMCGAESVVAQLLARSRHCALWMRGTVNGGGAVPLGFHCVSCVKACPVALHVVEVEVQFCCVFFFPCSLHCCGLLSLIEFSLPHIA